MSVFGVCRAIGIPARAITNFSSGHDTRNALTINTYFDDKGKPMKDLNTDSAWTYHVWTEAFMKRPDLSKEFDGWQVIDGTPQLLSRNIYRCGPASVYGIKTGDIKKPYDAPFVYAAVNADKLYWRYLGPNRPPKIVGRDSKHIGKLLSTKAAGKYERVDVTDLYKDPSGSMTERNTTMRALRQVANYSARLYLNTDFNDVYFELDASQTRYIGTPFDIVLWIKNKNKSRPYTVNVALRIYGQTYTGNVGELVKKEEFKLNISPSATQNCTLNLSFEDYRNFLLPTSTFNISCMAYVEGTDFEYYDEEDFSLHAPKVNINLESQPIVVNRPCRGTAFITNPLPKAIESSIFRILAPGMKRPEVIKIKKLTPPNGNVAADFEFTPRYPGNNTIAVKYYTHEMDVSDGYMNIFVTH